ncbi:ferredoxin [Streptomyces sp. NBC_00690]|uniref:ferredoxin n=1 Tax=Streptomyces sp. NBC_00690 TaxID=2975808 RepID=UPI002E28514D|nr:ferredoxin [Streptomyces sp. NBC_00690]
MSAPADSEPLLLRVDHAACCRSGACSLVAPDLFDQGDDGKVVLKNPRPPAHLREAAEEAADYCPVSAIRVDPPTG